MNVELKLMNGAGGCSFCKREYDPLLAKMYVVTLNGKNFNFCKECMEELRDKIEEAKYSDQ